MAGGGAANDFLHGGGSRPGGGGRPGFGDLAMGGTRPGAGGGGIQRPTMPGEGGGGIQRPTRPGEGGGGIQRPTRPGEGGGGIQRPTRPGEGGGGIQRPTRPGEGGGGIQRPTRPGEDGGGIQRPDLPDGLRPDRPDGLRPDRPTRPGQGGGGEQWRPGDRWPDRRPGGGDWAHHRPDHINNWNQWNSWRQNNYTQINNNFGRRWGGGYGYRDWYGGDWWSRHHDINWHWHYPSNFNYWSFAAWPAITSWFPWNWQQPVYYSYGDNVYYEGDQVYYGSQPIATSEEYAQQAESIATSIPDVQPAESDWMSLGVFAVTQDGEPTGADPTRYLQLAVSKQGIISGTIQNTATDTVQSIEGMVDKQTQRAAWTVVGQTRPIMETGIVNLTEETAPALVHFADGSTQQWLLVRLDKPAATGAAPASPTTIR